MAGDQRDLVKRLRAGTISRREFLFRALATGMSLSAAGALLQACGSAPSTPTTGASPSASAAAAAASSEPTPQPTLAVKDNAQVLTLWHGWAGADNTDALNKVLAQYNDTNTDSIGIQPTSFGWDDLFSKWVVSTASGNPPNVVMFHTSELPEFVARGMVVPIDDLVQQAGIDLAGVPDEVLKASHRNDQLYAVPGDVHPMAMYYNTEMAEKAGLDPTKPPTNQAEFLEWAQKLTIKDSSGKVTQYGVDVPSTGALPRWMWFSFLNQFGGTFLDGSGKAAVDSDASRSALQFLVDLIYKHNVASQGGGGLSGNDAFAAKQAAIRFVGPWEVNLRISQNIPFATAPMPVIGQQAAAWGNTHCLSIPKQRDTSTQQAGMKFIKWFYENYALPAKTVGIIPVSPKAKDSPDFTADDRYQYYKAFVDTLPNVVLEPSIPQYTAIFSFAKPTPLSTNLEAAFSQSKTIDQALKDMKQGIDEQLARPI